MIAIFFKNDITEMNGAITVKKGLVATLLKCDIAFYVSPLGIIKLIKNRYQ